MPLRNAIVSRSTKGKPLHEQRATILQKIIAGFISGAIGVTLANPFEVVKVRLQTQDLQRLSQNTNLKRDFNGTFDCFRKLHARNGVLGFW